MITPTFEVSEVIWCLIALQSNQAGQRFGGPFIQSIGYVPSYYGLCSLSRCLIISCLPSGSWEIVLWFLFNQSKCFLFYLNVFCFDSLMNKRKTSRRPHSKTLQKFELLSLRATPATGFMREKFLKIRL